ncbi:MAG: hypothetical protein J0G95_02130 [Rhizobiales bacterium]|nr:hypothetical protein [Hyphomicrobiales bacterium]
MPRVISIPITESPPQSVSDLVALHNRLVGWIDAATFSDKTRHQMSLVAGALRFDIAKAPAKGAADIAAKALFFIHDYCEVGPCEEFAAAMHAGIRGDLQRMGGAHV